MFRLSISLRALNVVALLLLISVFVAAEATTNTALFIAIPYVGHVNPLISQALELQRRGWKVYIVSCSQINAYVETYSVEFIDIGHCPWIDGSKIIHERASGMPKIAGFKLLIEWLIDAYPYMYNATVSVLRDKQLNVTVAIVDSATNAGIDICNTLNISCIINNPDILSFVGFEVLEPADYNPVSFMNNSIHTLGTNTIMRAYQPLMRLLLRIRFRGFDSRWNKYRTNAGFTKPLSLWSYFLGHVILSNTAFGLEYPRPIPLHIQLTGPMLNMSMSKEGYVNQLSVHDRQWIEEENGKPIIYVSAGTTASLSKEQVHKLFDALSSDKYRVTWKLSKNEARHLSGSYVPKSIRIVEWVSSSLGYFAHDRVKVFISHCGINSVYESVWLDTPIICLPMFADQYDMGHQVSDAGVGILLDKVKFTSNELRTKIEEILKNKNYSLNIKRVQAQIKLHGGVQRAADIIETVAQVGSD
ncbi:unnamed protein product, partial [Didymodactylos carnosus]